MNKKEENALLSFSLPPFSLSHSSFSLFLCNFSLCLARCSNSSNHFIVILHLIVCHELTHSLNKMYSDILPYIILRHGNLGFHSERPGLEFKDCCYSASQGTPLSPIFPIWEVGEMTSPSSVFWHSCYACECSVSTRKVCRILCRTDAF